MSIIVPVAMDAFGVFILFFIVPIILSIVALAQLSRLRATVTELLSRIRKLEGTSESKTPEPTAKPAAAPPPLPSFVTAPPTSPPIAVAARDRGPIPATASSDEPTSESTFNLESLLGVKLFAWIGGLALFLGVVFFVKYAFDNNWITPTMRIIAGAIVGVLLIVVSLFKAVRRYRVPAQSVCATGVLILYADIYAAHSFYALISLTAATVLMWIVTGTTLVIATGLNAQSVAWLAAFGGFLTPVLFRTQYERAAVLFGYIGILDCGIAAVSTFKRWQHLILLAAIGSIVLEFTWTADFFANSGAEQTRVVFLAIQALFLGICVVVSRSDRSDNWTVAAAAIAGFATLIYFIQESLKNLPNLPNLLTWDLGFLTLFLGGAGLIALTPIHYRSDEKQTGLAIIVSLALGLIVLAERTWWNSVFGFRPGIINEPSLTVVSRFGFMAICYSAIFLLFAATPYFGGTKRVWPWVIAAISGPLQFWFVHRCLTSTVGPHPPLLPHNIFWLLPLAFALPAAFGVFYLTKKEGVALASADSRLAAQGAAVVAFVSLVFPVQFHREWITLGWAIEGVALILLFRWIPNRRLRLFALIVLLAAFVRLALNPAVLQYHPRTHIPVWNWYLYAYGVSAICFFFSARWFGEPRQNEFERIARPLLYSLSGIVLFLLMNVEIADYFSIGPTLTFSFTGNFARDMTYTIAWSVFAFAFLILGIARATRPVRLVGVGLLCVAFAKLFLHDLDSLNQLYRIGAFITVAIIAIAASFLYQRFLSPAARN